jgi:hypothetical protein
MATVPGFGEGFPSTVFRNNIKNVMRMGAPSAVEQRVTFRWPSKKTFVGKTDPSGRPYDLASATSSVVQKEDVQIDCAVEILDRNPTGTPIGEFNNPRATITVLDVDYETIKGSTIVLIGGNTYNVNYVEPVGLFDVTIYTLHCQAVDEAA